MPQPEPIDPGKYNFPTLMNDIENGRVRLPPFQREFVWSPTKVIDLMDSIYKGFPIGPRHSLELGQVGIRHGHDQQSQQQAKCLSADNGYRDGGALLRTGA